MEARIKWLTWPGGEAIERAVIVQSVWMIVVMYEINRVSHFGRQVSFPMCLGVTLLLLANSKRLAAASSRSIACLSSRAQISTRIANSNLRAGEELANQGDGDVG